MRKKPVMLAPCLGALAAIFYLLPLLGRDTGTAMVLMLAVMPLAAFLTAVVYGLRNGFCLLLPIAAGILFLPTVFLYYNASAWVYAPAYALIVLAGNGLGRVFYPKR